MHGATATARGQISRRRWIARSRRDGSTRDAADALLGAHRCDAGALGDDVSAFADCGLVIEAIVEDLDAKRTLFGALEKVVRDDAVLATNTSSLSVASIASACERRERVVGIHFFNPPPLMPLVEIVPWLGGDPRLRRRRTR